jgi:integrase
MLTDAAIRGLKAKDKPLKKADGGGLFILVQPKGQKHWRLAYRHNGKQKLLSGGAYPAVSLADARKWRDAAKAELATGRDPSQVRKEEKRAARAITENAFQTVAEAWLQSRSCAWSPRYARIVRTRLEEDIFPIIGQMAIGEIEPPTLLNAIRQIERRGSVEMAHRVKNHCGEIFRFGIAEEKCRRDPSRDISAAMTRPAPVKHRAKVEAKDLPAFFAKLNGDQGERMSHLALRWTMLTMVRTQETRFAEWREIEGLDTDEPVWRIPASRMKMRSEHLVPLSPQAIALLAEIADANPYRKAGNERLGKFLFPVASSKTGTISENRMLDIMYRIGLRGKATVHGFRGLASTVLNESGLFEPDWIEIQLAHVQRGVRAAYNSARYLQHRRQMLAWWADYLDTAEKKGTRLAVAAPELRAA